MAFIQHSHRGIGLELSNLCNMQGICKHCDGAIGTYGFDPRFMPAETLEVIKKEIKKFFSSITYSGGEVACYPELIEELISSINLPYTLMTNGLKIIKGVRPKLVLVSIDPPDIRRGIDNQKIMENVLLYDCDLSVNTVFSAQTDIFELYSLLKETQKKLKRKGMHIREWKIGFLVESGLALQNRSIFPSWDEIFMQLAKFIPIYFKEVPFHLAIRGIFYTKNLLNLENENPRINLSLNPCQYCFNRLYYTVINLEGKLQLCTVARNIAIQVDRSCSLEDALSKIGSCKELKKLTYDYWSECLLCKYFSLCAGGCPGLAYIYTGQWTGRDVYQCEIMKNTEHFLLPVLPLKLRQVFENGIDQKGKMY